MNFKKVILAITGIILVIIITLFFLFIMPFLGTKKFQAGETYAGGKITNVADGMVQVFILDGGNGQIGLVDAGNSPDGKPVIDALAAKGLKADDVKAIFLTHGHPDHIAAAKNFKQAKIYSLKEEVEIVEGIRNNKSPLGKITPAKPTGLKVTNTLNNNDKIKLGGLDVEVFSIPGHTEGSAAYLISGVLILGDSALSSSEGKIKHAVWAFSTDVDLQNRSLKSLAVKLTPRRSEIKKILFSHSGFLDGLQPLIDFTVNVRP